MSLLSMDSSI